MNAVVDNFNAGFEFANIQAEQDVLGGLMLNSAALDEVGGLLAEHFSTVPHQRLYKLIEGLIQKGGDANVISVFEVLQRKNELQAVADMPYLNSLVLSVCSSVMVRRSAQIVVDRALTKKVYQNAMALAASVTQEGLSGIEAIARAGELMSGLELADVSDDAIPMSSLVQDFLTDLSERAEGKSADVIESGFSCLDNGAVLDGGFERGQLVVIGGRTGMGKTTLGFNLLTGMKSDVKRMVVSLEMSNMQLIRRCAASVGGVAMGEFKNGVSKMSEDAWGRVTVASEKLNNQDIFIQQRKSSTAYGICAAARKQKRKHGLDVLMIDHLGLMNHGDSRANTAEKIGDTTKALKNLAQELNIVVLLLVQINRAGSGASAGGEVKRPTRENLRDSGRIEEDADIIMLIHRDDHYRVAEKKDQKGHTHLICDKVRDGEPTTLHLKFEGQFSRFTDWMGDEPSYDDIAESKPKTGFGGKYSNRYDN